MLFKKNKPFLFHQPMHQKEKETVVQLYNHRVQVIVCGSLAKNVMPAINSNLTADDEKKYFAFQYCTTGKLSINATVDMDSNVSYEETRKKHNKSFKLEHDESINKTIMTSDLPNVKFEHCEPDFKSPLKTFLVIACNDQNEFSQVEEELHKKLGDQKIAKCLVLQNNNFSSFIHFNLTWPMSFYSIHEANPHQKNGKFIVKELEENEKKQLESIEQEVIDKIRKKILKGFEDVAHEKADEYFANQKRTCNIM